MCDTVVATAEVTADGVTLFGKNSDREPNEAHHLLRVPASDHPKESLVNCTYIEIPQVEHTYTVLLAKPFWIWGAEMGANEHGLVIGNEAVFTKVPYQKEGGLTGMDLLRLALERASTARQAVGVITDLLAKHGQGGNCGFTVDLFYHNSFLMADPNEAWVLETAGPHWAAKRVHGVYTISNGLTISNQWDLASPDLVQHAIRQGWCKSREDFDFSGCYSDFLYTRFSGCRARCNRTTSLLEAQQGKIRESSLFSILRDHNSPPAEDQGPDQGMVNMEVCMHAGFGPIRIDQTNGSMVSRLEADGATHFLTGTAAPCTSVFKPTWVDTQLPDTGPTPQGTYDGESMFWRHELLQRTTLENYQRSIQCYRHERDALEKDFIRQAVDFSTAPAEKREAFSAEAFQKSRLAEERWLEEVIEMEAPDTRNLLFKYAWNKFNRQSQMPADPSREVRKPQLAPEKGFSSSTFD
jgi:secernin